MRLLQGDYERETAYDADPVDAARAGSDDGAEFLHVVDLDGARAGRAGEPRRGAADRRRGRRARSRSAAACGTRTRVEAALDAGAARAVLGTAALRDPRVLDEMLGRHGERIVVSVDARGGQVALEGWTEGSGADVVEAVAELGERGVGRFVYTTVEVDGTMEGPALEELGESPRATDGRADRLRRRRHARRPRSARARRRRRTSPGVIVGRALYEGRFTVAEANAALGRAWIELI